MANQVEQLRAQLLQKAQTADPRYKQYDASIIDWAFSSPDAFFGKDASSEAARRRIMNEYPEVYDYIDAYYQTMHGEDIYQAYSKSIPPEFKKEKQAERMHEAQGKVMQGLITTIATIHGLGGLASMGAGALMNAGTKAATKALATTGKNLADDVIEVTAERVPTALPSSTSTAVQKATSTALQAVPKGQTSTALQTAGRYTYGAGPRVLTAPEGTTWISGAGTRAASKALPEAAEYIPFQIVENTALPAARTAAKGIASDIGRYIPGLIMDAGAIAAANSGIFDGSNGVAMVDENGEVPTVASDQPMPDYVTEQAEKEHQIRPITVVQQQTPEDLDHLSFGEAFATARRNKLGAFTWRGKAYNTALKSDPTRDTAFQDPRRDPEVIAKSRETRTRETAPIAIIPSEIAPVIPEASLMEEPNIIALQDQLYSPEPTMKQQRKEKT